MLNGNRDKVLHQLNVLMEQVDERWDSLTNKQVQELNNGIESLWAILCRRKAKQ